MQIPKVGTTAAFLIGAGLAAAAVIGYMRWSKAPPNDIAASERVVRRFVAEIGLEVRAYRQAVRQLTSGVTAATDEAAAVLPALEKLAEETQAKLDELAQSAIHEIEQLKRINWRTENNRVGRIRDRLQRARQFVAELAEHTRARLQEKEQEPLA